MKTKFINKLTKKRIRQIEKYTSLKYVGNNWFFGEHEHRNSDGGWLAMRIIGNVKHYPEPQLKFTFRRGSTTQYFRSFGHPKYGEGFLNNIETFTKWRMERFGWKIVNTIPDGWEDKILDIMHTSDLPLHKDGKLIADCGTDAYLTIDNLGEDIYYFCCEKHYKQFNKTYEHLEGTNSDDALAMIKRLTKEGILHN